jgi:AAA15 family ATPase/GTPase
MMLAAPLVPITFLDELDQSFHTELTRHLMELINRRRGRGQFVVTTHDTNLLDAGVFGRDAVWFVEKDTDGAARLYSLAEFDRAQLDALTGRIEQGYLQGRFGAIPVLGDPARLKWSAK